MDEKGQMGEHPEGYKCPMCAGKGWGMGYCGWHGGWHRLIRFIIAIAIIVIVFAFGVIVGELKGAYESVYGRWSMMSYYGSGYACPMTQNGYYGNGMMGWPTAASGTVSIPSGR